ncbi:MAG TPA: sigma-70 family RNA polymerase sigma factor [Kofleriaceae bacterium]|nr:sigma-70 family RNA polymerase sigma factor [Kofleriaceae bacterium]
MARVAANVIPGRTPFTRAGGPGAPWRAVARAPGERGRPCARRDLALTPRDGSVAAHTIVDMGAPADFQELYASELSYVIRTLQRLGVADRDLEDAAQDLFVIVYRLRAERDPARPVRPWLFGIAYRVVGNYRQKAHRRHEVATADVEAVAGAAGGVAGAADTPEQAVAAAQARAQLLAALDGLDLEHRAVAVLYEIEGLPAPVIAETLAIPLNTVYSRARAARLKLIEATRRLRGGPR